MKLILSIFFTILINFTLYSQPSKGDAKSNFDFGNYEIALQQYLRLLKYDKQNTEFHYRIGLCYLKTKIDKPAALPYLIFAKTDPKTPKTIDFNIAEAYFHAHKFDSAKIVLDKYIATQLPDTELVKVNKFKERIDYAKDMIKKPLNVTLINCGEEINTKRSEYNAFVSEDETVLYYTSNKKYISDFQELISGIYMSKGTNGIWSKYKSLGSKINTDESIVLIGVSKDGKTIYSQPETFSYNMDIFYSNSVRGRFKEVVGLGKNINSKNVECGVSITSTGDTLYFASNKEGGFGGMDIYYSIKLPNGEWGIPQNIGPEINTSYNENYPEISRDGKKIYFCSDGENSIGGYDIFYSKLDENTNKWGSPKNLGYPINDTYDNFTISLAGNGRYGYVALSRPDGYGDLDIYKVIFNNIDLEEIIYKGKIAVGDSINPVPLKDVNPDITISLYNKENDELFGTYTYVQSTGKYIISLVPGKFEIVVEGDGYETYKKEFEIFEGVYTQREYELNIYLKKK